MAAAMLWKISASVFALLLTFAAMAGIARVAWHEDNEVQLVERASIQALRAQAQHAEGSVRLARVRLTRDQDVTFEVCAHDRMEESRWLGAMALAVWRPRAEELMTRSELDARTLGLVRRNSQVGCLTVGSGTIGVDDEYAVEALWDRPPTAQIARVPLTTIVLAHRPLEGVDRWLVVFGWIGALGLALSLALRRPAPAIAPAIAGARDSAADLDEWEKEEAKSRRKIPNEARVALGLVLLMASFFSTALFPPGAALALGLGITIALFECGIAFALAPGPGWRHRVAILALARPERRAWLHFPIAIASGVVLWMVANVTTQFVPSTGESAVQSFVRWPSGMLSFATLAVIAPLAEEIFFRGFVYGVLEKRSRILAFAGAWLLFVVAHAPQTWGQWSALTAILVTGLGLTTLRAVSRSTLVPAVAHLVYNGLLALLAVFA
jgi:membrane protease YdiL (CAAX protease family)